MCKESGNANEDDAHGGGVELHLATVEQDAGDQGKVQVEDYFGQDEKCTNDA